MIGDGYWATGITVRYLNGSGWTAYVPFFDDGFIGDDDASAGIVSTQGRVETRYSFPGESGLGAAVDAVKRDAERLGVKFCNRAGTPPTVYYEGDGETDQWPPPADWRSIVSWQARRLGWRPAYASESTGRE